MLPYRRRDPKCHRLVLVFVRLDGGVATIIFDHVSVAQAEGGECVVDLEAGKEGAWNVESDAVRRVPDMVRGGVVGVEGVGVIFR